MRLHRLSIRALPGIEPGFDFEPASDRVNIVTGPNAIGKSSLVRALEYLLADEVPRNDPPDLHLKAEFLSGDVRWTVRRTGRQIAWDARRRAGCSSCAAGRRPAWPLPALCRESSRRRRGRPGAGRRAVAHASGRLRSGRCEKVGRAAFWCRRSKETCRQDPSASQGGGRLLRPATGGSGTAGT